MPFEYWHPPKCQFYKTKTGCKSGDTCLFPLFKVDEKPNKRPKKGSMHMVSEKDLNSAELETMRTSRSPTTVMTANGEVRTNKAATENVKQVDLFVYGYVSSRNSRGAFLGETLR